MNHRTYSQLTPSGRLWNSGGCTTLWTQPLLNTVAKTISLPSASRQELKKFLRHRKTMLQTYLHIFLVPFCSKCTVLANKKKNTNQKTIKNTKIQQIIHTVCTGSSFSLPLPSVQFHSAGNKRKSQQHSATLLLGSWSSQETRASKWTHIGDVVF